jgi:hypothetical protein
MRGPLPPLEPLIILASQHVVVELGLHELTSSATLVVPEMGGKDMRRNISLRSSNAPTRSTHTLVRDIIAAPPVAALHLAYASPSLRAGGRTL